MSGCFDIIPAIYLFNQNNHQLTEKSKIFLLWARRSVEDRMLCNSLFLFSKEKRKFIGVSLLFSTNLLCKFVECLAKKKREEGLPLATL